jgi:hypothetical protein
MGPIALIHWLLVALALVVILAINFIPTFVAFAGKHPNRVAIFVLNIFFGWTGIGWVICLVWALTVRPGNPSN